jgi:hypothetical protein
MTVCPNGSDVHALATSFMCELNTYQVSRSAADVATTFGATARYQPIGSLGILVSYHVERIRYDRVHIFFDQMAYQASREAHAVARKRAHR